MTVRGLRNNNPLNIRKGQDWDGEVKVQTDKAFEEFECIHYGLRAAMKLLSNYINKHNCNTVRKIIKRWAPENENDTNKYIAIVCKELGGFDADKVITANKDFLCNLTKAMAYVECGTRIDIKHFRAAYELL
jgi:hypothetical protein